MKKLYFLFLMAFLSFSASSQVIEITPSYGYQFGAKLGYGPNYLKLEDSDQFGVTLGVETYTGLMAELTYINMSSELRIRDVVFSPLENKLADFNLDWFLIGATRYFKQGKVKPFAGGSLGLVVVSPSNENNTIIDNNLDSTTRFAFSFKGGVNIMLTDVIGLNLQGNLYFPVNWAGVYVGPDGAGISTGSTVILGGFSAGLVFRLDKD
jgi:opacity protein-like surface antigen